MTPPVVPRVKAVILAAGRGSRMGPLTEDGPKCLTPLAGRPLLQRQLAALRAAGVAEVGIVRGYKAHLLDGFGLSPFENTRWAETNMVASLASAAAWLREGPVIVSYSDIFYSADAVTSLMAAPGDIAITYDPQWLGLWAQRFADPLTDAEAFRLEGTRVVEIGGRAASLDDIRGQYMGLLKITPLAWRAIDAYRAGLAPEQRDTLDMTRLLSGLIDHGGPPIEAVAVSGHWGEVDSASDLALYERLIAEKRMVLP